MATKMSAYTQNRTWRTRSWRGTDVPPTLILIYLHFTQTVYFG
jgi:hypothetical protein